MAIATYIKSALTDPGFLPRASAYEAFITEKENKIATDLSGSYYPIPPTKIVKVKGIDCEMKYCVILLFLMNNLQ
jgi:hypothetical protein